MRGPDSARLEGFVFENVETGATVFTTEHGGYRRLSAAFGHHTGRHTVGKYVNGMAHTNGIKGFWAMLKRGYNGTYHKISPKHLAHYVTEFAGRHKVRDLDTIAQMALLAKGLTGKWLRYDDLVARHG